jgi:hypothetical protein
MKVLSELIQMMVEYGCKGIKVKVVTLTLTLTLPSYYAVL